MKKERTNHLIWIDLEMTGLSPEKDHILEIASVVTDNELNILAQGPELVLHADDAQLACMNDWVKKQHTKSGLVERAAASTISVAQAETETLAFLQAQCPAQTVPLCGNSVWQDRAFLRVYMPRIADFVHYRTIDVTTVKELANRWYPNNPYAAYKKHAAHRALEDIKASIEELRYYRTHFFMPGQ